VKSSHFGSVKKDGETQIFGLKSGWCIIGVQNKMRNDPYTHFSQQLHNKLTWLVVFYFIFTKRKQNKTKKVIKYYQQRQLVVELL